VLEQLEKRQAADTQRAHDIFSAFRANLHDSLDRLRSKEVESEAMLWADEQQKQFTAGADIYKGLCVGCHQEDGKGKDKMGANLVDSPYVKSVDPNAIIRVLLSGKEGTIGLMPPVGATYSDDQIAAVLTFVRRSWGNTAPPVDSMSVLEVRGLTKARNKPWTDDELKQVGGRGGRGNAGRGRGGQ